MFVGHASLAFALVAGAAAMYGLSHRRAALLGVLAGAFATAPDVDIAYAAVGLVGANSTDAVALAGTFWSTGNLVHRAVTHSLVVAPAVALSAALWVRGDRLRDGSRLVAVAVSAALVAAATATSGGLGGVVMGAFAAVTLAVAHLAGRHTDFGPSTVSAAALVGLVSHPFGDLFTGEPPAMLYPFDATLVAARATLHPDPTLHLLSAFALELLAIWLGVGVAMWLAGVEPTVTPRATLGAGYAASVLVIPAPTLDLSYPFVFSVLGVGLLGVLPVVSVADADGVASVSVPDRVTMLLTGLSAVTVAWAAYSVAYLLL